MNYLSPNKNPVIIFNTTPDYIQRISLRYKHETMFIVDKKFMGDDHLKELDQDTLLFSDLNDPQTGKDDLLREIAHQRINPVGMGCFDCEALLDAADLAICLDLPFPSLHAISKARNKFESKHIWMENGVPCSQASLASDTRETLNSFYKYNSPVVLKPLAASGSELTFLCRTENENREASEIMEQQIANRKSNLLFRKLPSTSGENFIDPTGYWVVEEYIEGPEFSCDFLLHDDRVSILRLTEKVKDIEQPFGSILAYIMPATFPAGFNESQLSSVLKNAVSTLGFSWGWFMADFIIKDQTVYLLEITPRPGGDSIPDLIETAAGVDILSVYLDFISGQRKEIKPVNVSPGRIASLNIYAEKSGIISYLDISGISGIPWVKKIYISRKINDRIILPPLDYESRKIGHCIINMEDQEDLKQKQRTLLEGLQLKITDPADTHMSNKSGKGNVS